MLLLLAPGSAVDKEDPMPSAPGSEETDEGNEGCWWFDWVGGAAREKLGEELEALRDEGL